jgi:hypothetical protein
MKQACAVFALTLSLCLTACGIAVAAPMDDAEVFVKRGFVFVKRGIELRKELKDREALDQFRRAYQLAQTPRIEAQMGAAEQALGSWLDAESHIASALSATTDQWIIKNRPVLETSLAAIRTHLGMLEVIGGPEGADIKVDGRQLGKMPLASPQRVAAGHRGAGSGILSRHTNGFCIAQ